MRVRRVLLWVVPALALLVLGAGGLVTALYVAWRGAPAVAQLLVLRASGEVVLYAEEASPRLLVDDISTVPYSFPVPAPDGRSVAYVTRRNAGVAIARIELRSGQRTELYRTTEDQPFYISWSPDGQQLAVLSSVGGNQGLRTSVVATDGSSTSREISTTSPAYFTWAPDGRLLLHVGGSIFDGGELAVYAPGDEQPGTVLRDPGLFQAPAWSRDGRQFFYVAQPPVSGQVQLADIESRLTRVDADGSNPAVLAIEQTAVVFLGRAPDRDAVAYITVRPEPDTLGALRLVEPGGEPRQLSAAGQLVSAFFWSPDGQQIAYLTAQPGPAGPLAELTWHVVHVPSGETRALVSFVPGVGFDQMLQYFDAYAAALSVWSPDSRSITYSASDGVYVIDVTEGTARRIGPGIFSVWVQP